MEETKRIDKKTKEPVYVEKPDKTIIRTKHPRIEITCKASEEFQTRLKTMPSRSHDGDIVQIRVWMLTVCACTFRMAYEWVKHQNRIPDEEREHDIEGKKIGIRF